NLPSARSGAPPVRGKGACSHPILDLHLARTFHPALSQADLGKNGRKVMSRKLTAATALDNLRKETKRWLKALRGGDAQARRRFETAYRDGPADPVLRDVQHALAREYEFENWTQLKQALAAHQSSGAPHQSGRRPKPEDYQRAAAD